MKSADFNQVLVFTRTKLETNKLVRELQRAGIAADSIHGDKSQQERLKALEAFKDGSVLVLVATDVAARGLDIDELPHVINFELPRTLEAYIHRIGRTGRACKPGTAISLVSASEVPYLVEIEKLIRIQVEQVQVAGFEPEAHYSYPPDRHSRHRHIPAPTLAPLAAPPEAAAPRSERGSGRSAQREASNRPGRPGSGRSAQIAADGFDFSKPYECAEPRPLAAAVGNDATLARGEHPHKPRRLVAALLGGLGRK